MDRPGMVANRAPRGQPHREKINLFPVPGRAGEFGPARLLRPSRPAPAHSSSTLRLNLVLFTRFFPLSATVSIYTVFPSL